MNETFLDTKEDHDSTAGKSAMLIQKHNQLVKNDNQKSIKSVGGKNCIIPMKPNMIPKSKKQRNSNSN